MYGEAKRAISYHKAEQDALFAQNEKLILENYIEGLKALQEYYDDAEDYTWIFDLQTGNYTSALEKTVSMAIRRGVTKDKLLNNKTEGDNYFNHENLK